MSDDARSDYKGTWNAISQTLDAARCAILGSSEESEFGRTAAITCRNLEATVGIRQSDVILEIGCGIGRVGTVLAPCCREWIGCDVSSNMLNLAKDRLSGLDNIRLVEISGFDLQPIGASTVDMVYCHVVLMHLWPADRYGYIVEARRVLRPGGRLFIDNIDMTTDEGWEIFEKDRTLLLPPKRPPHMSMMSTPDELRTYLLRAGFENVTTRNVAFWVQAWGNKATAAG